MCGMHEDLGAHAGQQPDPTERAYRLAVLLDGVPEAVCVELMQQIADVLVEHGLASPPEGPIRSAVAVHEHDWVTDFPGALWNAGGPAKSQRNQEGESTPGHVVIAGLQAGSEVRMQVGPLLVLP